jgi:DNA invertase Pin-like site-specific DNA recombinase
MMRGGQKITSSHLNRTAMIYLRQSTLMQVREHGESTARQYGLAGDAARLGWAAGRIEVIDCDLGLSGRTATHREGFRELLGRVCAGEVGAVFGLEISRLARSSADLSRLLEIARLTDTLVIDADGIYDLADINDRLLLGLKGQMSEAELHLLHSRLDGARLAAAARGDLRLPLPAGYVYDDAGQTVKDPDEEVAAAVSDMFAAFTAAGSAYGVVAAFTGRRFPGRAGPGGRPGWGRLTYGRVVGLLHNPVYAGAYVFGRHRTRQQVDAGGSVHARTRTVARDQWQVLIPGHHEGYITWDDYLAIEAKMAANQSSSGERPPREGGALCQGIIYCGCGRHMGVSYPSAAPAASSSTPPAASTPAQPPSTPPSPRHCSPRSPPPKSNWQSPPPARSPRAASGSPGPPSSPSSEPATRPTAQNGHSPPANPKTGSSPAPSKPGGKHGSPSQPTPRQP